MNVDTFFKKFELFADAPNAVGKMRELVLDLAIRGKLVAQYAHEGSAIDLLQKIETHKQALLTSEQTLRIKPIAPENVPSEYHTLPANWLWVRFGDIVISRDNERIPVSKEERNTRAKTYDYYGASGIIDKIDNYIFDKPLLLIGEDGANLINRATPIAYMARGKYWVNNHAHVLDGITEDFLRYIEIHINAIDLKPYVTGSAQPKMNQAKMNSIAIALPPLAEQKRIVAKVDELMALCDRLEAQQQERETRHAALAHASLTRFADAPTPENLELLFHKAYSVEPGELRKSILTLAVQGKLVPQNQDDDSADVILKTISIHRFNTDDASMVRQGPYEIPQTWRWTALGEITNIGTGSTPSRTESSFWSNGTIPWITSGATSNSTIDNADEYVTPAAVHTHRLKIYPAGTLIVALYGQGKTRGQVAELTINASVNQACAAVCQIDDLLDMKNYLRILLLKQYDEMRSAAAGGAQPNLNLQKIKDVLVPLPPLPEQKRIVAKVDQLMALVDQLEVQLAEARGKAAALLDAVVAELSVAA